jgi:hypothetical protein
MEDSGSHGVRLMRSWGEYNYGDSDSSSQNDGGWKCGDSSLNSE